MIHHKNIVLNFISTCSIKIDLQLRVGKIGNVGKIFDILSRSTCYDTSIPIYENISVAQPHLITETSSVCRKIACLSTSSFIFECSLLIAKDFYCSHSLEKVHGLWHFLKGQFRRIVMCIYIY